MELTLFLRHTQLMSEFVHINLCSFLLLHLVADWLSDAARVCLGSCRFDCCPRLCSFLFFFFWKRVYSGQMEQDNVLGQCPWTWSQSQGASMHTIMPPKCTKPTSKEGHIGMRDAATSLDDGAETSSGNNPTCESGVKKSRCVKPCACKPRRA